MNLVNQVSKSLLDKKDEKFLLTLSGGLDSIALLQCFDQLDKIFNLSYGICYFHHGPSDDERLLDYRFNAFELLQREANRLGVPIYSNCKAVEIDSFLLDFPEVKNSEASFRQLRYEYLNSVKNENGYDWLVFGHHQDDLLETRILRLIRGVGPQGLESMKEQSGDIFRPLLNVSRFELKEFVVNNNGGWLEDPSNSDEAYLRNWLRKKWLPELELRVPGGMGAMARSLDLMTKNGDDGRFKDECIENGQINLAELLSLGLDEKRQVLASYMKGQGLKNYGLSHINEVLKRLDTEKKSLNFRLLGRCWIVDAGRMSVQESS